MRPHVRAVLCATLLPAALLVADPSGYSPFGPSKWAAITVVGLLAVAATAWAGQLRVARRPSVVWVVFLGWVIVAAAVGLDPLYAWIGTPERHFGVFTWVLCFLLFVVGQRLDDEGDARLVVGAGVVGGGLAGAWALAEKLGWRPIPVNAGSRLIGSLGSAAFLGAAMTLVLPMALGVACDPTWDRRYRVVAGGCVAAAAVALVGSGARAAWAGTVLGVVLVVALRWSAIRARLRRSLAIGAVAAVAVVALAAGMGVAGRVPAVLDRAGSSGGGSSGGGSSGGGSSGGGASRLDEWAVASKVLSHHPVTGVGPEGYRIAFPEGADAHYVETYGVTPLPDRAHDSLLDVAVATGLPGVALYLILLGLVGVFVVRATRRGPAWLVGLAVGIAAYVAQGLALFPLAELDPAVWLLAGVVVAHVARPDELVPARRLAAGWRRRGPAVPGGRPVVPGGRPVVPARSPRRIAAVAAVVVFVALAIFAAIVGGRDVLADRATKSALAALAIGDGPRGERLAARAVSLRPDQVEYQLAAERADAAPDTPSAIDRGLADLAAAHHFSPSDPVLVDERGRLLLERALRSGQPGDLVAARADLERLVAANPLDAEDQLRLGVAAAQAGDVAGAQQAWGTADRLDPTSAAAATDLATLYARGQRWSDAAAAARHALARDPTDAQAHAIAVESAAHLGT